MLKEIEEIKDVAQTGLFHVSVAELEECTEVSSDYIDIRTDVSDFYAYEAAPMIVRYCLATGIEVSGVERFFITPSGWLAVAVLGTGVVFVVAPELWRGAES